MNRPRIFQTIAVALAFVLMQIVATPASAQSVLRDAETEQLLRDIGDPLMEAAGLDPRAVHILVVGDDEINAFATLGQSVYVFSGLIIAAKDVRQLQGVLAHELGHVAGGHAVRSDEGAGPAGKISLLSLVFGAALMAAGAGDAGMATMMAGQQAATGKYLAFSREQESRADMAGAQYLNKAGVDGSGMISFFKQLQGEEFRLAIPQDNAYDRTHPLSGERIANLQNLLERSPYWNKGADPVLQARYQRVRAKLIGYISDPAATMKAYPPSDTSIPAHVARAYAFHKMAEPDKAVAELDAILRGNPKDAYALEMKGQILLESGRPEDAAEPLREAVAGTGNNPLIASMLGHALVQTAEKTRDPATLDEAERVLKTSLQRDAANPFGWLQLETIYERKGDRPRLALATAERLTLSGGNPRAVLNSANVAANGLPKNTPEWLRAEDLVQFARNNMKDGKKNSRNDD